MTGKAKTQSIQKTLEVQKQTKRTMAALTGRPNKNTTALKLPCVQKVKTKEKPQIQ